MSIAYRTMKDLKEKTPAVLKVAESSDVVITKRGKPHALLRRITDAEVEGLTLLESKRVRRLLEKAIADVKAGRTTLLDELIEEAASAPS